VTGQAGRRVVSREEQGGGRKGGKGEAGTYGEESTGEGPACRGVASAGGVWCWRGRFCCCCCCCWCGGSAWGDALLWALPGAAVPGPGVAAPEDSSRDGGSRPGLLPRRPPLLPLLLVVVVLWLRRWLSCVGGSGVSMPPMLS